MQSNVTAQEVHMERLRQVQRVLQRVGLDLLLVSPSADLKYLVGYGVAARERPTILALGPEQPPMMIVPQLEALGAAGLNGIQVLPYAESQNPFNALVSALAPLPQTARVAVSDTMWASFLLQLQPLFPSSTFVSASPILRELRMVKSEGELELLARAGQSADEAFAELVKHDFAGKTERELADLLNDLLRSRGLETAVWGPIVGSGPNSASPHHETGDRVIESGDAVVVDFGGIVAGYQADITRTVHVGPPDETFVRVYDVVRTAQQAGVEGARPGVAAQTVDRAARAVIEAAGYGEFFVHRTGHGLGLDTHEEPYIIEGNELELAPGMVFSVEPGIYLPGRFGVRIEDIVAVTEHAASRLNQATRNLVVVD